LEKPSEPLTGKRIVVTRAPEQAQDLIRSLEQLGAEVLRMPTVRFVAPADGRSLDRRLRDFARFDWVLFTSQNAVRFFCQRCQELGLDRELFELAKPLLAAVGRRTAQVATQKGLRVDLVAKEQTGEGLARELRVWIGGRKLLLPRSDRGDRRLSSALRGCGAEVTEVIVYRTAAPEALDPEVVNRIRRGEVDTIVFASPSAFHNLCESIGSAELAKISARIQFAAIGPTTARALREAGSRVEIEANEPSVAGLSDSIAKYYQRQVSTARHI
jgi:uroporphyrinogen III methyltransferase / synthase